MTQEEKDEGEGMRKDEGGRDEGKGRRKGKREETRWGWGGEEGREGGEVGKHANNKLKGLRIAPSESNAWPLTVKSVTLISARKYVCSTHFWLTVTVLTPARVWGDGLSG